MTKISGLIHTKPDHSWWIERRIHPAIRSYEVVVAGKIIIQFLC